MERTNHDYGVLDQLDHIGLITILINSMPGLWRFCSSLAPVFISLAARLARRNQEISAAHSMKPNTKSTPLCCTVILLAMLCSHSAGLAQTPTATSLALTSSGSIVSTVKEGTIVTLTATVTLANGSAAAPPGQVEFC